MEGVSGMVADLQAVAALREDAARERLAGLEKELREVGWCACFLFSGRVGRGAGWRELEDRGKVRPAAIKEGCVDDLG